MINAAPLNTLLINGALLAPVSGAADLIGAASVTFTQSVSGYIGSTTVQFSQLTGAIGGAALDFSQTVDYPSGYAELVFMQVVGTQSMADLTFAQNVYSVAAVNYANWTVVVTVAGVDISGDLVDSLSITAERGAARIATFTLRLSGMVDALSWVGRSVAIDYAQDNGVAWRRFTGVIVEPVLDITGMELRCACSDDLQRIVDNHTRDQLLTLSGGRWSKYMFAEDASGWDVLQDMLSTVPTSVEMDAFGALRANSFNNKLAADYSFGVDIIDDATLNVALVQRSGLVNRVNVQFNARFERLYQREERLIWARTETFCQNYAEQIQNPTKTMVRDAVDSADWVLLAERYTELWPTSLYYCAGGPIGWINADPELIRGFDVRAAKRWRQSVTRQFNINVTAPASIAAYNGELASTLTGAADFKTAFEDWGDAADDYSLPSGFARDELGNDYADDNDLAELSNALQTITAMAIETINGSHRANTVSWRMPLAPYLELSHTLAVDTSQLQAKGVVGSISETYQFDSGEATTEIELWLSSGQSGLDSVGQAFSLPDSPAQTGDAGFNVTLMPTHIGTFGAPAFNDDWFGVLTNRDFGTGQIFSGVEGDLVTYPFEIRLPFEAVPDSKTQNFTDPIAHDVAVAVPHNTLIITA